MQRLMFLIIVSCLISGCGTLFGRNGITADSPSLYKGVRADIYVLSMQTSRDNGGAAIVCYMSVVCPILTVASLPIDVVIDTVLLPIDAASSR